MKWSIWGQKVEGFISSFKDLYVGQRSLLREIRLKHNTINEEGHLRSLQCREPFVLFHGRDQNQLRKMVALSDVNVILTYLLCLYNH